MSNEKGQTHPIFDGLMAAIHPSKNKLDTPTLDAMQGNLQKEHEESESMKKILWQYKEDVLNPDLPFINLTNECERIYLKAAMEGVSIGMSMAMGIITTPTLDRYNDTNSSEIDNGIVD